MQEKLKALTHLQNMDLEIASLKKAAEVHPKQIAELEKELGAATSELEAERGRLLDIDRQRRTLEQNIADEKEKVKKWEARLAEQRSTREYAALAREIDIAKKSNVTLGEELTELGKTQQLTREALKIKEGELLARQERIGGQMKGLREKMKSADEQVKELEKKRAEAVSKVDPKLLQRYEQVRKKRMPVLVPVHAGTCQGCNMNVPPQLYNQLRVSMSTDICPSCHRMIYAPPPEAPSK